ncbi:hypothetical protein [Sphingobium tyrosinilyticum]|uniref:Gas vesicle protein K n=1 Tax=Sphingobium tyrosinilyticum TaxID=2715436 RepID=A0ABV9EYU7_9SPHN
MADLRSNDNDSKRAGSEPTREPDAYGQAAMLLVESLIHALIARSVISVVDAVEIVGVAAEVKEEIGLELGDGPATMQRSVTLLRAISASLKPDIERE